jgi:hypothetical protein
MAAPATATTNPRFTTVLLIVAVIRRNRRTIVKQYGVCPVGGQAIGRKSHPGIETPWL